jgi:hypothetical protein
VVEPPPRTAEAADDPTISSTRPILPDGQFVADDPDRRPSIVGSRYPAEVAFDEPVIAEPMIEERIMDERIIADPAIEAGQPTNSWSVGASAGARIVNSRSFEIDYEVADVGPSGLSAVEFYITTDDGTRWWRYGNDEDRQSPFPVTVPREGVYGFAMRARSGVGLADDPPQPGERPSIVINVDRTAPQVTLLPVQQGTGRASNRVLIRWSVDDANPAEKPVALSYAEDPNGPWEPISGWTEDAGEYSWTVGPGVPARFHIRLTARDAAGNVTRAETDRPVIVDLMRPSARIVDVQSIDGQADSPR